MAWSLEAKPERAKRWLPALVWSLIFQGLGGLNVGDGALWEVNVEAQEVEVVNWFQFDWVTKEVVVDQCLDGWVGQEVFVADNESVVDVSVVGEVECCVLKEVVV